MGVRVRRVAVGWLGALLFALSAALPARVPSSGVEPIRVTQLPREAHQTLKLIQTDGPFPYERDGITFGNYEKRLPLASRGHYREYTVKTPGVRHRGARRVVVGCARVDGGKAGRPTVESLVYLRSCRDGGEFYYTDDHYRSFRRIVP